MSATNKTKERKKIDIDAIQKKAWLSEKEAVEYTGFNREQLRNYRNNGTRKAGTLPYVCVGGKFIRYNRNEIDKWLMKHAVREAI